MTHTTDQERPDFEVWAKGRYPSIDLTRDGDDYSKALAKDYWSLWQAARRAPVVPEVPTLKMLRAAKNADCDYSPFNEWLQDDGRDFIAMYRAALAASPQPQEATVKESLTVESAPVQLPEPAGWIDDGGMVFWNDGRKPNDGEIIYTDQQVRTILAQHGIKTK